MMRITKSSAQQLIELYETTYVNYDDEDIWYHVRDADTGKVVLEINIATGLMSIYVDWEKNIRADVQLSRREPFIIHKVGNENWLSFIESGATRWQVFSAVIVE